MKPTEQVLIETYGCKDLADLKQCFIDNDLSISMIQDAMEAYAQQAKDEWVSVDGYKEVPTGNWLVYLESEILGNRIHSGCFEKKIPTIGNLFAWDYPRVIAFKPLPSPPKQGKKGGV